MRLVRISLICSVLVFSAMVTKAQEKLRVVSLAASITKNIQLLNAEGLLVGCTNYCGIDPEKGIQVVATAIQVNIEQLVRLQPDLVITTPLTNPETLESIRKFSIPVEIYETPKNYQEILEQFIALGKILGYEARAKKIADSYRQKIDSLVKQPALEAQSNIFFQLGTRPIFTVLPETFMNDYIQYIGGRNIFEDMNKGIVTRESVLERNPDVIFIATMGQIEKEEQELWYSYKGLKAAESGKIYIVDADLACTPSPDGFYKTLKSMMKQLAQ